MADFSALIQRIKDAVYENGVQAITGQILQDCLKDVVNTVNVAKQDGIYRVTVTVDNNTGVPSATARMDDDTYTLEFSFHNLKGETGPQGPQGDTPVLTADSDGVIYSDGVILTRVIKDTTDALTTRADSDHARAESDHARAETDHTDITRARGDAETAAGEANFASLRANTAADNADAAREAIQSDLAQKQDVIPDLQQIRAGATDTVKYSSQSLTDAQKEQARTNIGAASDSEVSQLRSEVEGEESYEDIDLSSLTDVYTTINSSGKWASSATYFGVFIPVNPGDTIKINVDSNPGYYGVLTDDTHLSGGGCHFAEGYTGRVNAENTEFVVPVDGHFIFAIRKNSLGAVDTSFQKKYFSAGLLDKVSDLEDSLEAQGQDIEAIHGDLDGTSEEATITLDISSYYEYKAYIVRSTGKWTDDNDAGCVTIPVNPGDTFILDSAGNFAILQTNAHIGGTVPDFSSQFPSVIHLEDGESQTVVIPDDGNYLYAQTKTSSGVSVPVVIKQNVIITTPGVKEEITNLDERVTALEDGSHTELRQVFESMPAAIDSNGWEIPTTPGMVYALKKAAQASQIVYNALANYPSLSSPTGAAAGEHTGLPYSSTKEIFKYIGYEVSLRTFMTAIQNVYGMFYTEDISSGHGQSGYGYTYNGTNCGPYYGMVCSIFTGYCLGFDVPWDTAKFAYLAKKGILVKVSDQTPQGVHICDLVWYSGHVVLVTGVQRDQYGNVVNVQITESLGAVHSTSFTAAQFETYLHTTHDCIIYRPTTEYEST